MSPKDDAEMQKSLREVRRKLKHQIEISEQAIVVIAELRSDLSSAREEIAELRKALKPFAKFDTAGFGEMIEAVPPDPMRADRRIEPMWAEDFRRAREALRSSRTKGETP